MRFFLANGQSSFTTAGVFTVPFVRSSAQAKLFIVSLIEGATLSNSPTPLMKTQLADQDFFVFSSTVNSPH